MPNRSATAVERRPERARRRGSAARTAISKCTRMKKRSLEPVVELLALEMLPPWSTRKPVTACTIPGRRAGQGEDVLRPCRVAAAMPRSGRVALFRTQCGIRNTIALLLRHGQPVRGEGAPSSRSTGRVTILEILARAGEAGVTEIAAELGVHKSTAFRLVAALERTRPRRADRGPRQVPPRRSGCSDSPAPPRPGSTWCRRPGRSAASSPPTPARPSTSPCSSDQLRALPRPDRRLVRAAAAQLGRPAHPAARHRPTARCC